MTCLPKWPWSGGDELSWRCVALLLLLVHASSLMAAQSASRTLDTVRLGLHEDRTRIVFDISGSVEFEAVRRSDPSRIVLDISDTVADENLADAVLVKTPVQGIHTIAMETGSLQVEIYLAGDFDFKTLLLSPYLDRGYRLVVDIFPRKLIKHQQGAELPAVQAASGPTPAGMKRHSDYPARFSRGAHGGQQTGSDSFSMSFDGTWEQEWAVETNGANSQKFEALIEPRFELGFANNASLTAIARIRLDTVGDLGPDVHKPENYSSINGPWYNNANAGFSLRELYLDTKWINSYWRIGKQQVVWGQADGIKVLDVINPQSFREFILDDFDSSRIPLTMVNMEMPVLDDVTVQILWIPDTTYHELAEYGTPYFITSPLLVPIAPEGIPVSMEDPDVPDNPMDDSDVGGRLSGFIGGWDVTVNYLYHYQDYPVFYQKLNFSPGEVVATVSPEYRRSHLSGGTLSNAFGDFTLRGEVAYSTDTFHISSDLDKRGIASSAELASVIGLDWQLGGYDTLLSAQWFQSHLFDYYSSISRDETEHNLSFYYQRNFANETWQFNTLALYSINNQDSLIQAKLKYFWRSNIEVWIGADFFSGDRDGIYGEFRNFDRMLLGLEMGF
jgi:Protein of unknown function (DUF1302)/AMIN domain